MMPDRSDYFFGERNADVHRQLAPIYALFDCLVPRQREALCRDVFSRLRHRFEVDELELGIRLEFPEQFPAEREMLENESIFAVQETLWVRARRATLDRRVDAFLDDEDYADKQAGLDDRDIVKDAVIEAEYALSFESDVPEKEWDKDRHLFHRKIRDCLINARLPGVLFNPYL